VRLAAAGFAVRDLGNWLADAGGRACTLGASIYL